MKDQTLTTVQVQGVAQWQQYANSVLLPRTVAECAGEELSAEITAIVIDGIRAYLFTGSAHHSTRGERLIGFGNDPFFCGGIPIAGHIASGTARRINSAASR